MTYPCPKGCDSTDPQWCSECGAAMIPASANPAPVASGCPDCGAARPDPSARYCEVCRYDFETAQSFAATGQPALAEANPALAEPEPTPPPTAAPAEPAAPIAVPPLRRWDALIDMDLSLDPEASAGQPVKPQRVFPLELAENLIGRRSDRLNVHPEIPIEDDPGVSRRHARIFFTPEGAPMLQELGSANGTMRNGQPVEPGVPATLSDGDQLTLGRWTRITIKSR
jgi:hypothetical protein